jgi:putative ABC transport system permease protein
MKLGDLTQMSLSNLWRTKLRTTLTTLGVIIGIGALVSMVSFGTGLQKNVTAVFRENDLFTSLYVSSQKVDLNEALDGDIEGAVGYLIEGPPALNDTALIQIQTIPGVEVAFPEVRFPVKIRLGSKTAKVTLQGLPASMGAYRPYNNLAYGTFFSENSENELILTQRALRKLNLRLRNARDFKKITLEDSIRGIRSIHSDALLNREIEVTTSVIDLKKMAVNPFQYLTALSSPPIQETKRKMKIVGIQTGNNPYDKSRFTGSVIVPIHTAVTIPHLGFSNVWEILGKQSNRDGYDAVYVRTRKITDVEPVREVIEAMGFGVFSITDQIKEIKRGFLILDTALGAVGTIALIVAALGIINTMVMSILERTREIGIMKAIGGSENEIKTIFLIESGCIGVLGGLFGLLLGWIVTRIANLVANLYLSNEGMPYIDFFYIPSWLILGAIAFSIIVSLSAGLYPATRAAQIDPLKALRHD